MEPGRFYVMPVVFGPTSTPRAAITGERCCYINPMGTLYNHYRVVFETDPKQLEQILPEGFELIDPYVFFTFSSLRNCAFLAGRGYELVSVEIPTVYQGKEDKVRGLFEPVLWEDHGDNCNIGREQSGFSKVFGDIKAADEKDGKVRGSVSTWGFKFVDLFMDFDQPPEDLDEMKRITQNYGLEGRLHYKYIPRTGNPWLEADCEYIVLAPYQWEKPEGFDDSRLPTPSYRYCKGELKWYWPEWRDTPTQSHIIQYMCNLQIKRYVGSCKITINSLQDLRNSRILK